MTKASISAASSPVAWGAALMRWYRTNGRHKLPWRQTRDPYAVLVSEVMLQQTQVDRVLPYYMRWLEQWPTFAALAEASPADVIREWRGLGYNRRALNLHRLAVDVAENHGGRLPKDPAQLRALPGVGPYTASAIRCFAREEQVPVADTNIARVLARLSAGVASQRELPPSDVALLAADALPARGARAHNLALMDLGALACHARAPKCGECPVQSWCLWHANGHPEGVVAARRLPAFTSTARFARGKIIDALRESPAIEAELRAILPEPHAARLSHYLDGLAADGLAVKDAHGTWALPR